MKFPTVSSWVAALLLMAQRTPADARNVAVTGEDTESAGLTPNTTGTQAEPVTIAASSIQRSLGRYGDRAAASASFFDKRGI